MAVESLSSSSKRNSVMGRSRKVSGSLVAATNPSMTMSMIFDDIR
jgi:hypothetical protein